MVNQSILRLLAALLLCLSGWTVQAQSSPEISEPTNTPPGIFLDSDASSDSEDDTNGGRSLSNKIRPILIGKIHSITIKNRKFYDLLSGKFCRYAEPDDKLTKRHVRYFLENAEPVSPSSFYRYYHSLGECFSSDVIVRFKDGRRVAVKFSDSGTTAYISPIIKGRDTDIHTHPYICRACDEDDLM